MKLMQRTVFFLLFLTLTYCSFSQESTEFGQFTSEEIAMKECSFDIVAEAVILLDKANSNYIDQYNMVTERRIRLKILKEKGISRGNISIYFASKNNFEAISRIKGFEGSYDEIYLRGTNSLY